MFAVPESERIELDSISKRWKYVRSFANLLLKNEKTILASLDDNQVEFYLGIVNDAFTENFQLIHNVTDAYDLSPNIFLDFAIGKSARSKFNFSRMLKGSAYSSAKINKNLQKNKESEDKFTKALQKDGEWSEEDALNIYRSIAAGPARLLMCLTHWLLHGRDQQQELADLLEQGNWFEVSDWTVSLSPPDVWASVLRAVLAAQRFPKDNQLPYTFQMNKLREQINIMRSHALEQGLRFDEDAIRNAMGTNYYDVPDIARADMPRASAKDLPATFAERVAMGAAAPGFRAGHQAPVAPPAGPAAAPDPPAAPPAAPGAPKAPLAPPQAPNSPFVQHQFDNVDESVEDQSGFKEPTNKRRQAAKKRGTDNEGDRPPKRAKGPSPISHDSATEEHVSAVKHEK